MMDFQDLRSTLDTVASNYNRLLDENKRLKKELNELKQMRQSELRKSYVQVRRNSETNAGVDSPPKAHAAHVTLVASDVPEGSYESEASKTRDNLNVMHINFDTDERKLIDEKRNTERARLQTLIAEFDPEEAGEWAKRLVTPPHCAEMLKSDPDCDLEPTLDELQEVTRVLTAYCAEFNSPPTCIQLVNMTSTAILEETFGVEHVDLVMRIQDAIIRGLTNELVKFTGMTTKASMELNPLATLFHPLEWLRMLRHSPWLDIVEAIGTVLVILNTIYLGISVDAGSDWRGWDFISAGFAVLFVIELIARMVFSGGVRQFFSGKSKLWNAFDTMIVIVALADILTLVVITSDHINTRTLMMVRMTRLIRLTRVARLARTGLFNELAYMIRGIEAGTSTLVWAMLLLLFVSYIGGVLLTQTVGRDRSAPGFTPYSEAHFGSVSISMFTLFQCFTGDCSTFDGKPLSYVLFDQYGRITIGVYWVCIILVTFGLFNVIIANFLQNSQRAAKFNDHERRRILKRERLMVRKKTASLLKRVQEVVLIRNKVEGQIAVADIVIDRATWRTLIEDEEIMQWLEDMGCDDTLRRKLFDKIDRDGNGELECNELVSGIVDLLRGRFDNMEQLTTIVRSIHHRLVQMEGAFALRQHTKALDSLDNYNSVGV